LKKNDEVKSVAVVVWRWKYEQRGKKKDANKKQKAVKLTEIW